MQMKFQRKFLFVLTWILVSWSICSCDEEEEKPAAEPPKHENFPRLFRVFSRPGDKSTEKQEGSSIVDHLGNVFKGGSIGFEVEARPLGPFHDIIDKAKEFIPNPFVPGVSSPIDKAKEFIPNPFGTGLSSSIDKAKELFPIPFLPRPPKDKDTDRKDTEVKPKPEDQWEPAKDFEPVDPGKDSDTSGPKFEGIDKEVEEESDYYTTEPIENIIQPRIRTKRSPESKVFHVPVQFLSNAKPYEVKIK